MAHLFIQDPAGNWGLAPLRGDCCSLHPASRRLLKSVASDALPKKGILLQRVGPATRREWALLASPDERIFLNGARMEVGMRSLRDRDELLLFRTRHGRRRAGAEVHAIGTRLFFSTEELARIVPFVAAGHDVFCVRCQQPIDSQHPAVQCPNPECGHWHHAGGDLECWTYDATCAMCDQSTAPEADYRWTPEDM